MKRKIRILQAKIEQDPKFKEAIERMRPQKNIWGILGIVTFFFLPEIVVYLWQDELVSWAHRHSLIEPLSLQRMLYAQLEEMFASGVSWFNITLGVLFLVWLWRSK
ncbi:MAG: hypothetical protein DSZ12_01140 [Sulfurovum sp.]|nr:MAG: hypothetical protein DSZ12_01140 [Sulfurovum sp.]